MSDIGTSGTSTRTCANCGAQNDRDAGRCVDCGAPLTDSPADRRRDELELEEVWRAVAASGYDRDARVDDRGVTCPVCDTTLAVGDVPRSEARPAVDTASNRGALLVAAYRCPSCASPLRAVLDAPPARAGDPTGEVAARTPSTYPAGEQTEGFRHGAAPRTPVEEHPERFGDAGPGTLAEQADLTDAEGEDIRHYTGEPVETEEGWVVPGQQNTGAPDSAGGGEWPDPDTPPVQPLEEAEDPASEDPSGR